jgi:hypothetical protein
MHIQLGILHMTKLSIPMILLKLETFSLCQNHSGGDHDSDDRESLERRRKGAVVREASVREESNRSGYSKATEEALGSSDDSCLLMCVGLFLGDNLWYVEVYVLAGCVDRNKPSWCV